MEISFEDMMNEEDAREKMLIMIRAYTAYSQLNAILGPIVGYMVSQPLEKRRDSKLNQIILEADRDMSDIRDYIVRNSRFCNENGEVDDDALNDIIHSAELTVEEKYEALTQKEREKNNE